MPTSTRLQALTALRAIALSAASDLDTNLDLIALPTSEEREFQHGADRQSFWTTVTGRPTCMEFVEVTRGWWQPDTIEQGGQGWLGGKH
jgi:hypothetical protein